jgi:hypothetical protein
VNRQEISCRRFPEAFNLPSIAVKHACRSRFGRVYIGDEFVSIIFRDDEDGDLSYNFTMAILDIDLE